MKKKDDNFALLPEEEKAILKEVFEDEIIVPSTEWYPPIV